MKRTESNTYPEQTQLLQGVLLVNYDVLEIERDGEIVYNYAQDRLQQDAPESDVLKAIAKGTEYWVRHRKNTELDTLIVTASTVPFDADNTSINYMSAVLTIANLKMIQALAAGVSAVDAYNSIYKTSISWRNANNTISNVELETVGKALEECMTEVGNIKTGVKYNG